MYPHPRRVCGLTGEATPKQIEIADNIHDLFGLELPAEKTKQAYSDFINAHIKKYKEKIHK